MSSLHDTASKVAEKIVTRILEVTGAMVQPSTLAEADIEATAIIERHFAAYRKQVLEDAANRLWWGPNIPEFTARSGGKRRADRLYAVAELRRLAALPTPPSEVTNG